MSHWRDARLQRALEAAPDAQLLPGAATRRAVLEAARQAVAPVPRPAWWKRLWPAAGTGLMPWNAALATVALATLVTVIWRGQEIPGARTDTASADRPATARDASPPAPFASEPPRSGESASSAPSAPAPPPVAVARPKNVPAVPAHRPPVRPQVEPAPAGAPRERGADQAVDALRDLQGRALAKSAPPRAEEARHAEGATAAQPAAPTATAPAAAPAAGDARVQEPLAQADGRQPPVQAEPTPPVASRPPALAPPAASLSSRRDSAVSGLWTAVRITGGGRSIEASRDQASALSELLSRMARRAQTQEPLEAAVTVRIELKQQDEVADLIELGGTQLRWTRWRAGRAITSTQRPDPAELHALQAEAERLLGR